MRMCAFDRNNEKKIIMKSNIRNIDDPAPNYNGKKIRILCSGVF